MSYPIQHRRRRGQAIVEFALIVTTLTLLVALAADFGRAFSAWIDIGSMARAGAQYGSVAASFGVDDPAVIRTNAIAAAHNEQAKIFGSTPSVCVWYERDADNANIWNVAVKVSYDFHPIVQIPPIPSTVTIPRVVRMRMQFVPVGMSSVTPGEGAQQCG